MFRYAEIVGEVYYKIQLSPKQYALVDAHFLAASHHRFRSLDSESGEDVEFHAELYYRHVFSLMRIVSEGDFSKAQDIFTKDPDRKMDSPERWNLLTRCLTSLPMNIVLADKAILPDAEMFDEMLPDIRWLSGDNHPYDALLDAPHLHPEQISLKTIAA